RLRRSPNITAVQVNSYSIGDDGAQEFAARLRTHPGTDGGGRASPARGGSGGTHSRRLSLHGPKKMDGGVVKREMAGVGGVKLGRMLEANTTLVHLDLSNNAIGAKGMVAIAESLACNRALKSLDLSGSGASL